MLKKIISAVLTLCVVLGSVGVINTPVMAEFKTEPMVARGSTHTVALKEDGTVWAWGSNSWGELGNETMTSSRIPVQISGLTGVKAIATGDAHTVALKEDGTVWAWGYNYHGQLGNGTTTDSSIPVQVKDLEGVKAIAAAEYYTIALKEDGTVWAWGWNEYGQLGNGTKTNSSIPVQVKDLTEVKAIAAGARHTIALKTNGTVWAWGYNYYGQLGNGTKRNSNTPVQVSGLTGVKAIAVGSYHTIVLKKDGTVWAWGDNDSGELGNGTKTDSSIPVQVKDLTGVKAIAGGYADTIALKEDGTVWAWGYNNVGQLGNGTTTDSSTPVQVSGLTGIKLIDAGSHTIALKEDGTVWAWGYNISGQLGNGTKTNSSIPVQVINTDGTPFNIGTYTSSINDKSSMTITSNKPNMVLTPGGTLRLSISLNNGGDASHITAVSSDSSVIEITENIYGNNKLILTVTGKSPGMAYINFCNSETEEMRTVRIVVNSRRDVYTCASVPVIDEEMWTNFYDFQGMFIERFEYKNGSNGSKDITFSVYNTSLNPAIVEVYNANSELIKAEIIDKMNMNTSSIKGAVIDNSVCLWNDLWDGDLLTYRQESGYSKQTDISVNVPKGGYIKITADPAESTPLLISDIINMASSAKSIVSGTKSWTKTDGENIINAVINSTATSTMESFSKKVVKSIGKKTFKATDIFTVTDYIGDVINAFCNIGDEELTQILNDAAMDVGFSAGQGLLIAYTDFIGTAMSFGFSMQDTANLYSMGSSFNNNMNKGSVVIQVPNDMNTSYSLFNVASTTEDMSETALKVFKIDTDDVELIKNENVKKLIESSACCYDISLLRDNTEVQPSGEVTVTVPVVDELKPYISSLRIKRVENDGTLTDMNAVAQTGTLVFTTNHFSVYMLDLDVGDINGDGFVSNIDSVMLLRGVAKIDSLNDEQKIQGDVDKDGDNDILDVVTLEKYVSIIESLDTSFEE